MSSCAVSCYTCFPKVSSAFATSASSPIGGALMFCRYAFNYSARRRRQTQKPPPPNHPARFGFVPTVAAPWWSSRDLRLPKSNSVLRHARLPLPREIIRYNPKTLCVSPRSAPLRLAADPISSPGPFPSLPCHRFAVLPAPRHVLLSPAPPHTPPAHLNQPPPLHSISITPASAAERLRSHSFIERAPPIKL